MKINNNIKVFRDKFVKVLAFTATLGGFLLVFFPIDKESCKWCLLLSFVLINILITFLLARPKKKIIVKITERIKVNIYYGDILECKTNIVIPFNSDFDTKVDETNRISSNSLHGIFINKVYGSNVEKLTRLINEKLKWDSNEKMREPLGTMINLEEKGKNYFLLAFTNIDNKTNKAYINLKEYHEVINCLLKNIQDNAQGNPVYLPLLGAGQSGVDLSKQELLEYLLIQIKMNKDLNFNGGLNIVLHKDVEQEISLERIHRLFNKF